MSITANEIIDIICDKEFVLKGEGYDSNDVDDFLDDICGRIEDFGNQNEVIKADLQKAQKAIESDRLLHSQTAVTPAEIATLQARIDTLTKELEESEKSLEEAKNSPQPSIAQTSSTLETILLNAQRLSDEAVDNATVRAKNIIRDAQEKASRIVDDAQTEKSELLSELDSLRESVGAYRQQFSDMLNRYQKMLNEDNALFD